jgi:peptidoglycan/xylan/chitin deacetylase (PgdA/CDA1 family)
LSTGQSTLTSTLIAVDDNGPVSDTLVLCYHAVSERWPAALSVTPERLHAQLRLLVRQGYRGVTFREAVSGAAAGKTVAVTFDDAFASVLRLGSPVLSELGLPGTVFVPTAFPDGGLPLRWPGIEQWLDGPHRAELEPMSWAELRRLADAGWEIGSHTRTHPHLTRLSDERLAGELRGSREDCEARLGAPCHSVAYPYGDVDRRVVAATASAGYAAAGALPARLTAPRALEWPRVGIYRVDAEWRFRLKTSPAARRARGSRVWERLDRARR